ncbi:MAG: DNA repair protein RecO [Clostridia bacterium]|jgi:DNA repair protein RecO (recombination protein O)|nr:DNA repair protein RecO [Clostridia bacterium]
MITDTEGIILRQFKTVNGRTMLVMFSRKLGKISVATNMTGGGKNRSALSAKPFTYGKYELYKGRELYDLNSGRVIESYYGIGDDLDRFSAASYCLELTDRILMEEDPQPRLFGELTECLRAIENSRGNEKTLTIAYIVKALDHTGTMPELDHCASCGKDMTGLRPAGFSVGDGGIICGNCCDDKVKTNEGSLIYTVNFDIINILKYFKNEPFSRFEKIRLDDRLSEELMKILKSYMAYHLDVKDLKSEFMTF